MPLFIILFICSCIYMLCFYIVVKSYLQFYFYWYYNLEADLMRLSVAGIPLGPIKSAIDYLNY